MVITFSKARNKPVGSCPGILCLGPPLITHYHPQGPCIIHLTHRDLLADHLLVDAVHALQTTLHTPVTLNTDDRQLFLTPERLVLVQQCEPYTGKINSETSGASRNTFLHCGHVLGFGPARV